jgi:hypothetical protein
MSKWAHSETRADLISDINTIVTRLGFLPFKNLHHLNRRELNLLSEMLVELLNRRRPTIKEPLP